MKKNRLKKVFILLLIGIVVLIVYTKYKERQENIEYLNSIIEDLKQKHNLTVSKEGYEIGKVTTLWGLSSISLKAFRNTKIKYKSVYFKEMEDRYYTRLNGKWSNGSFFNPEGLTLLRWIVINGLKPYVLNELLYDKSRGNDFEKIEEIFKEYKNIQIEYVDSENSIDGDDSWNCENIRERTSNTYGVNFVKNPNCKISGKGGEHYNLSVIKKYGERYEKYFSIPRTLETIDWEEYIKIHEIYPVIVFRVVDHEMEEKIKYTKDNSERFLMDDMLEAKLKKIREEIRERIAPYYNKDILYIKIQ